MFGLVLLLGITMIFGRNPFARMQTVQAPVVGSPAGTAYLYGLFMGPMTLPCTGPLVISVFILGAGSAASFLDGVAYFVAFGLGFGWPLVVLPFLAVPMQRRFTGFLTTKHLAIIRLSGLLLVVVAAIGSTATFFRTSSGGPAGVLCVVDRSICHIIHLPETA